MGCTTSGELVGRLRESDPQAWREVQDRFGPVLRWVAVRHRLLPEEREDVLQTTWLRLWEHLGRLREPEALPGWLVTTCRRESLRTVRLRARQVPQDPADAVFSIAAVDGEADPHDHVERRMSAAALYEALDGLPDRQRTLLLAMLDHDGATYEETSQLLRMPVGSVGPTRLRALARLRQDDRLCRRVRAGTSAGGPLARRPAPAPVLRSVR